MAALTATAASQKPPADDRGPRQDHHQDRKHVGENEHRQADEVQIHHDGHDSQQRQFPLRSVAAH